jgi:HPP family
MEHALVRAVARVPDLTWATLGEGALIGIAGVIALWSRQPFLFASLGPTAFELAEMPERPSGSVYHVLVGHGCGIAAGFIGLWLSGTWHEPVLNASHPVTWPRVLAAIIAAVLTVFFTIGLKAQQPASLSTTLTVALGGFQAPQSALYIGGGVLLLTFFGEPLRWLRIRAKRWQKHKE